MVAGMLGKGACVLAVKLPGFSGLLKDKLGPELAQYAKSAAGVKGIFHSDELPDYGISMDEVTAVKKGLSLEENDAFALVVEGKEVAEKALNEVIGRCRTAFLGVPKETRRARDDGSSEFMRPLPGSARMYPETDEVPVALPAERLTRIRENLSETPEKRMSRYMELDVGAELAGQLVKSKVAGDFDEYVKEFPGLKASLIAGTLLSSPKEAKKKYGVDIEGLGKQHFMGVFALLDAGKITKESVVDVLAELAKNPDESAEDAVRKLGLGSLSDTEIDKVVGEIIAENPNLAEGALMGKAMAKLRGKAEAGKVAAAIKLRLGK
jgi:glutamyl-tRNA(Gln) amidotransferase subunit E